MEKEWKYLFILSLLSVFLYLWDTSAISLTDPDEVFYSETAKEMIENRSYLTPLIFQHPQFEKPPLFYWLLVGSFKVLGVNTISARLVPALFGILGVIACFLFLRKIFNLEIGFYSGLVLATSFLYLVLSRAVLTDIVFSVLISLGLYFFYLWYTLKNSFHLYFFGLFCSLAVLTKGPLGLLIPLLTISLFFIFSGDFKSFKTFVAHKFWIVFFGLSLPWYLYMLVKYGKGFWWEFFLHDNWHRFIYAEHKNLDKWWFYPLVIMGGMFPWTGYFFTIGENFRRYKNQYLFFSSWIIACLLIFISAHSKLASYILPLFPALAIILGISISSCIEQGLKRTKLVGIFNIIGGIIIFFVPFYIKRELPELFLKSLAPFAILSLGLILSGISIFLKSVKSAIALTSGALLISVFLLFAFIAPGLESAFSDSALPRYLRKYDYGNKPILCNKIYVRGVYFWTHNPVLIIDSSKNPFWSSHPLQVISTDSEIKAFFRDKNNLLSVLKYNDLKRIVSLMPERKVKLISGNLNRFVVLITD